ncbi:NACHT, LRR and PYD domains-containing protein 1a-like [Protobothrops mucrosquamatus]|uniref:NACHT, LRR and PYD domains-containing protein 1a-like n=1 Tax=Protobothrops mucrosquamatus TaxID=103944 RepID=UPI0007758E00|nr:NACHT, LRR and PYD domains-containing protein 1a-like [Protobothrops mucrosquamatus]
MGVFAKTLKGNASFVQKMAKKSQNDCGMQQMATNVDYLPSAGVTGPGGGCQIFRTKYPCSQSYASSKLTSEFLNSNFALVVYQDSRHWLMIEEAEEKELQLYCSESVEKPEEKELQNGGKSEVNIQQCCKHCIIQKKQHEQVTPRRFLKGQFCLKLDDEGTFECTATGLIFEVTRAVTIEYSVLSWTKYAAYVKDPWIVVGPIFDIKCTSSVLTSIQFPHTLCLNDHLFEKAFKVFHFKKNGPEFEGSIDHSTTHVKWNVSSLSPVGPVIERYDPVYYHGVVILYKVINNHPSLKFRVYIATNNNSFIKDISKTVRRSLNKFIKIEKPPCHKLLQNGKKYRLTSDPEADITPEEIQFGDDSTLAEKPFFEVYLEQPMELMLSLVDLESEEVVWKAKLRESDWTLHNQNDNEQEKSFNCKCLEQICLKLVLYTIPLH